MTLSKDELLQLSRAGMRAFVDRCIEEKQTHQIDFDIMDRGEIIDITPEGVTTIQLELDDRYRNLNGKLHGGAIATIFDCYTTVAFGPFVLIWTGDMHRRAPPGGVSRNLNVTYLRPVTLPATVRVTCEVMSYGKIASYVRGTMVSPDGKQTYATCEHHKLQVVTFAKESAKL